MALAFFTLTGKITAVVADYADVGTDPDVKDVSCTVTFTPRIPRGGLVWAPGLTPPQGIALPKIVARCDTDGVLRTIVGDAGVKLTANTADIDLDQLIYDVTFTNVVYDRAEQIISGFAFEAPTSAVTVDMSTLDRLPYKKPTV